MGILLLNIIATAALYCGPIIFLRYVVFQKKINKDRALKYVLISSVVVFILIRIFTDYIYGTISTNIAPAFLWGNIGYFILAGTKKKKDAEDIPADTERSKAPSMIQIPEKKSETTTEAVPYETKHQKAAPVVQSLEKKSSQPSSNKKYNILLVYSIVMTILAIVFLGLSMKFYDAYEITTTSHYYVRMDGKVQKIIGYYSSTGELVPFDFRD